MCVTCGCSEDAHVTITHPQRGTTESIALTAASHTHMLPDGTVITHAHAGLDHAGEHSGHAHAHVHAHAEPHSRSDQSPDQTLDQTHSPMSDPNPPAQAQLHAQIHRTTLTLEQNILAKNDLIAAENRGWLKGRNTLALNFVSSPGSGKTTLLIRTIQDLQPEIPIHVIEGDQETMNDARRIQETGCQVVQINTGTGCHLEAAMVQRGLRDLNPPLNSIVLIENVGNLVCPALFDLGEHAKIVILSVTEGEDKPIKYPHMFRASDVMILTKIDLLPYVPFDLDRCIDYAHQVNPQIKIFQVSALTGAGLNVWYDWLRQSWQSYSDPK